MKNAASQESENETQKKMNYREWKRMKYILKDKNNALINKYIVSH